MTIYFLTNPRQIWLISLVVALIFATTSWAKAQSAPINDLRGLTLAEAEEQIEPHGYKITERLMDSKSPRGTIIDHFPREGGTPGSDGVILATVSNGLVVPAGLIGSVPEEAEHKLKAIGASVATTTRKLLNTQHGRVIDIARFSEGDRFDASSDVITIVVAQEIGVIVPNLGGDQQSMRDELASLGLSLDYTPSSARYPGAHPNPCYSWFFLGRKAVDPAPGTLVPPGTSIRVVQSGKYEAMWTGGFGCNEIGAP